jgi:hypothetical protein
MRVVIGWDVGGAHLEAARAEGGRIVAAIQIASPLWLGVSRLDEAFRTARFPRRPRRDDDRGIVDGLRVALRGRRRPRGSDRVRLGAGAVTLLCRARGLPLPRRRGRPFDRRRLGQLACERRADRTLLPASAAHRHGVDDDRHHSHRRGRPRGARLHRRATAGDRGARLRRPRAELGIREHEPCDPPAEA